MMRAFWAGDLEAGGLIVAASTPERARCAVARWLFEEGDYYDMRARRVPAADQLIDQARPDPHDMADYADVSGFYSSPVPDSEDYM